MLYKSVNESFNEFIIRQERCQVHPLQGLRQAVLLRRPLLSSKRKTSWSRTAPPASAAGAVPRSARPAPSASRSNEETFKNNASWSSAHIRNLYAQADTGGILLAAMGNPADYPIYWDHLLLDASQVTNPSIDPLREPMELRTYLGKKPHKDRDRPRREDRQAVLEDQAHPAAEARVPVHLLRHELRRAEPERPPGHGRRGRRARHHLQYRRGRSAQGPLPLRQERHRPGRFRPLRRQRAVP